ASDEPLFDLIGTTHLVWKEGWAARLREKGIVNPVDTTIQDLSWIPRPRLVSPDITYTTWKEYFARFGDRPRPKYRLTQEKIIGARDFGSYILQAIGRTERRLSNLLPATEKLSALTTLVAGLAYPGRDITAAWRLLADVQHHDCWAACNRMCFADPVDTFGGWEWDNARPSHKKFLPIPPDVSRTPGYTREPSWQIGIRKALQGTDICHALNLDCTAALAGAAIGNSAVGASPLHGRVLNTSGYARRAVAELPVSTPPGTQSVRVTDEHGAAVPAKLLVTRKYYPEQEIRELAADGYLYPRPCPSDEIWAGESVCGANLLMHVDVPAVGYSHVKIEFSPEPPAEVGRVSRAGDLLTIETDLYTLSFDAAHGGAISAFYDKVNRFDLLKENIHDSRLTEYKNYSHYEQRRFGELYGFFGNERQWLSSTSARANIEVIEDNVIRTRLIVTGLIGTYPFETQITVEQGNPVVDFITRLRFKPDTRIGNANVSPIRRKYASGHRDYFAGFDDRPKLCVLFPSVLGECDVYKNAAFDVCKSEHKDSFYDDWDNVKNSLLIDWADFHHRSKNYGLGVFSDHTTNYTYGYGFPPRLVMAWGNKEPEGIREMQYGVYPHAGTWDSARFWQHNRNRNERTFALLTQGTPATFAPCELLRVEGDAYEVNTLQVSGSDVIVRLFNAESDSRERRVTLGRPAESSQWIELDGRIAQELDLTRDARSCSVQIALPRFGFRTLRFRGVA
ncbi:MAG: hypothetical protein FJ399_13615, partial [Verrucomicrobia bacterium]|nr:hypothetical protein [Verrucomicrobiota bacterium]